MNCRTVQHHLYSGADVSVSEDTRSALAAHVAECAACRRIQQDLTVTIETWRAETGSVRAPDPDLEWQKLRRKLHGTAEPRRRSLLTWVALPLAAAAAVAIGLYVAPGSSHGPATATSAVASAAAPAATQTIAATAPTSTVIYTDDKSGWTFVWGSDGNNSQHI